MAAGPSPHLQFVADASYILRQSAPETSAYLMSRYIDLTAQQVPRQTNASVLTDAQRQRICTGCGNIMIPGCNNTQLSIETGKRTQSGKSGRQRTLRQGLKGETAGADAKLRLARPDRQHVGIRKIYSCGLCGKDTRIALPPPAPLPKYRKRATVASREGERKTTTGPATRGDTSTASTTATSLQGTKTTTKPAMARSMSSVTTASSASNASSKKRAKNRKAGLLALLDKSRETTSGGGLGNLSLSLDDFRKK